MNIDPETWERWVLAVTGQSVVRNSSEFTYMLENLGEFELRALLRTFPRRDALYERFAHYALTEPQALSDMEALNLADAFGSEMKRLAILLGLDIELAHSSDPLSVERRSQEGPPLEQDSRIILDRMCSGSYDDDIRATTGLWLLSEVAAGFTADAFVVHYILEPLLSLDADLSSYVNLVKAGYYAYVDGAQVVVVTRGPRRLVASNPYISGWPTDADIEASFQIREQTHAVMHRAADLGTSEQELAELVWHPDEQVRYLASSNPNLPSSSHARIVAEGSDRIVAGLAASPQLSDSLIAELLDHPSVKVREALALRSDLPSSGYGSLAKNQGDYVQLHIAQNPTTPLDVLRDLMVDESTSLRTAIARRDDLPDDMYSTLAQDPERRVRTAIRLNPAVDDGIKPQAN